jgi:hypothetical protein
MKKPNLTQTLDAQVWAKEWLKTIKKNPSIPTDEGTMISWFSNAIMAGYDACYNKYKFALTEDTFKETKVAYKKAATKIRE